MSEISNVFQSRTLIEDGGAARNVAPIRIHDYVYDPAFVVSSAKDYARAAFKAAMASSQAVIQPVFNSMFSELTTFPRMRVVYHPNCRMPEHMDLSYNAHLQNAEQPRSIDVPLLNSKYVFKFNARPNRVLATKVVSPDLVVSEGKSELLGPTKPKNRGTQSLYRESSAQTTPWQPDAIPAMECEKKPEVLYLEKLEWGPGRPYRNGDLPADFHTTEIINKMRHARAWMELVEKGEYPRWMKKTDALITDIETKDWIFREAEIDELQEIRLVLLHKLQGETRTKQINRTSKKLAQLWTLKKKEMERKVDNIRRTRDRELRKLAAAHGGGGRMGLVASSRNARGGGPVTRRAHDPASDVHAPLTRHGYQARNRHADITYDPQLLSLEDHMKLAEPPAWLQQCGQDLVRTCSGHHRPRDPTALCERETKWSEQFLENLHNDLKKARLGAATTTAGPLRVLKPRRLVVTPRPATPEVEAVHEDDEVCYQSALMLQKLLRGRAVQTMMYEGRSRAAELTEELKTTHGLQREDQARIATEQAKARDYHAYRTELDHKEDAITALVDELCGGAVSAALDFLEKELRRLKDERRQHAFILIAMREKVMREAAEAGRRQKEEHRRREHDEMFKQVLGVTQETVDVYLQEIIQDGVELAAEEEAVRRAQASADRIDQSLLTHGSVSTAEQNELVAELVQQFLIPEAHKTAARHRIAEQQKARLHAARDTIFGLMDDAEIKEEYCLRCGRLLDELCRCRVCPKTQDPVDTKYREDPRWKHTVRRSRAKPKDIGERFPPEHDFRCMLNTLVDEVVVLSRSQRTKEAETWRECSRQLRERIEITIDARDIIYHIVEIAIGAHHPPVKKADAHFYARRFVSDALERTEPFHTSPCPEILPSELRRLAQEEAARLDPTCRCVTPTEPSDGVERIDLSTMTSEQKTKLLPSELRILEEFRRCKCDLSSTVSFGLDSSASEEGGSEVTTYTGHSPPQ